MLEKTLILLSITILAASCAGVKVHTDTNRETDFSKFETFSFMGWQDVDDELFTRSDLKLIQESFIKELESRGLKKGGANADLRITAYLVTGSESAFSGYNDYVGGRSSGYNHYRWGYGYSGTTSRQQSELMGTLIMNVYEGKSKNQIWQAVATGKVNDNPKKDRSKMLPSKVSTIMRKFPIKKK